MPYYQWTGVTIEGQIKKGRQLATSPDFLEETLLQQNIAVMSVRPVYHWPWQRWRQSDTLDFFSQLSALLTAGIFSTDALALLLKQQHRHAVLSVIESVHADVCKGSPLSAALEKFPDYFDHVTSALLRAGEESGNVARALEALCAHIEFKQHFYRRVRSAALMPCITLAFFVVVCAVIITVIVPKFATFFVENNQQLPGAMQALLACNAIPMSAYVGVLTVLATALFFMKRSKKMGERVEALLLALPWVSSVIIEASTTYFLKTLSVLLQGGVPLVPALRIAQHAVSSGAMKEQMAGIVDDVSKGRSLSEALASANPSFFSANLSAMIKVGEESGTLGRVIEQSALRYEMKVAKALELFSVLFQPLAMAFLGLLIAFLIMAVYMPIFELSNAVSLG